MSEALLELKQTDEACDSEHLAQIVVQTTDIDVVAVGLGTLQDAEEDAKTA